MSQPGLNTFSKEEADHQTEVTKGQISVKEVIKMPLLNINDVMIKYFGDAPTFLSVDTEGLDHARGGTGKPLALGVLAEMSQKRAHGLFGGCPVCPFLGHNWLLLSAGSSDRHGFGGG